MSKRKQSQEIESDNESIDLAEEEEINLNLSEKRKEKEKSTKSKKIISSSSAENTSAASSLIVQRNDISSTSSNTSFIIDIPTLKKQLSAINTNPSKAINPTKENPIKIFVDNNGKLKFFLLTEVIKSRTNNRYKLYECNEQFEKGKKKFNTLKKALEYAGIKGRVDSLSKFIVINDNYQLFTLKSYREKDLIKSVNNQNEDRSYYNVLANLPRSKRIRIPSRKRINENQNEVDEDENENIIPSNQNQLVSNNNNVIVGSEVNEEIQVEEIIIMKRIKGHPDKIAEFLERLKKN